MLKRFTRNGPNSSLQIDDNKKIVSTPDGKIDQSKTYFRQSLSCLTIIQLNLQKNTNSESSNQLGLVLALLFFVFFCFMVNSILENWREIRELQIPKVHMDYYFDNAFIQIILIYPDFSPVYNAKLS